MGICSDNCTCYVEGDRGLMSLGTGSSGDPFTPQPDLGRTIPRTEETAGDLPALTSVEDGQLAFVKDTGLVYQFNGDTLVWDVIGPEWRQTFPNDEAVDDTAGTWVATDSYIVLEEGYWFISSNGVLVGSIDAPASSGTPSVDLNFCEVEVRIADTGASGDVYDTTRMTAWAFSVTFDSAIIFNVSPVVNIPYHLQDVINVPIGETRLVTQHVRRLQDGPTMALTITSEDVAAIRVANSEFTV